MKSIYTYVAVKWKFLGWATNLKVIKIFEEPKQLSSHFAHIVDAIGCLFRYCAFWSGFFIPLCSLRASPFFLFTFFSPSPPLPPFLRLPRRLHSVLSWNCCRQLHTLVTCDFIKRRSVEVMNVIQVEWRGKNTKREIQLLFFPQLLTPVALANCLLTKNGDCATVLIKVCGVGWGHSFRIPSL